MSLSAFQISFTMTDIWRIIFVNIVTLYCRTTAELAEVTSADVNIKHILYATQAFFLPIRRELFKEFPIDNEVEYRASLLDMPDLPSWMYCRHPNGSDLAYLYGAPNQPGDVSIEIIALNKQNYQTSRRIISLQVQHRGKEAQYEVELKLLNLNIEDMFEKNRLQQVEEIFRDNLWSTSDSVYITMVASAIDLGGRLPLNPKDKEGVIIRVGGTDNFTRAIMDLETEAKALRNRNPCPKDYKRTAVEHLFRSRNLISDWCSFRLIWTNKYFQDSDRKTDSSFSPVLLTDNEFRPPATRLPRRDFLLDFVISLIVPSGVVILLLVALTCLMCCHREGLEKRNKETPSMQLNQYSTIQRASNQLRQLAANNKRNSLPKSTSTPGSSLPRSRTASPTSTLPKTSTPRPESRMGTLRPFGPPLPPPYTPSR